MRANKDVWSSLWKFLVPHLPQGWDSHLESSKVSSQDNKACTWHNRQKASNLAKTKDEEDPSPLPKRLCQTSFASLSRLLSRIPRLHKCNPPCSGDARPLAWLLSRPSGRTTELKKARSVWIRPTAVRCLNCCVGASLARRERGSLVATARASKWQVGNNVRIGIEIYLNKAGHRLFAWGQKNLNVSCSHVASQ